MSKIHSRRTLKVGTDQHVFVAQSHDRRSRLISSCHLGLTIANSKNSRLIVRLGHLVDIVNRVFQSLDLNPLLINTLNNVTSILEPIVGEVAGLLGSITQGGTVLSFLVDNLGNIVQQVVGTAGNTVSSIVGNYLTNM